MIIPEASEGFCAIFTPEHKSNNIVLEPFFWLGDSATFLTLSFWLIDVEFSQYIWKKVVVYFDQFELSDKSHDRWK